MANTLTGMKHIYRIFFLALLFCGVTKSAGAIGHTVSISWTPVLCNSLCNGTATATVSGGTGPFTYLWSPGNMTIPNPTSLCAGIYTVTVTDQADASTATATVNIVQPGPLYLTYGGMTPATCYQCNGSATMSGTGGVAPYTYNWAPCCGNSPTLNNACQGTYTCWVTDANGCTSTSTVTITSAGTPTINSVAASPSAICPGQSSSLTPTITGGVAPFTFSWTNPGNTLNNPTLSSPTATPTVTTTYTCTVTDANGCTAMNWVTVSVYPGVGGNIISTHASCNQSNGSMSVNITQGSPPYNVVWSNGQTTMSINNLSAGTYNVVVTDVNACSTTLFQGVNNIGGPSVAMVSTNAGCTNSSNGSAGANVTGIAPFTYSWNTIPAQNTAVATNLGDGSYLCAVTDSAGCITVGSVQVNATAGNLYMYAGWNSPANCNQPTGAAYTYVQGGTNPYTYAWSNGATTSGISNVVNGQYSITVTDANGCTSSGTTTIPIACNNYVFGRVYFDSNQDNVFNGGDFPLEGIIVHDSTYNCFTSTDSNGLYRQVIPNTGIYSLRLGNITPNYQYGSPSNGHYPVNLISQGDTAMNADFAMTSVSAIQDVNAFLASGIARSGFAQQYSIQCGNNGTTIVSDTIWFTHDSLLPLISSTPAFDGYTYPTGYWLYNNLIPGQQINKVVWLQVPVIFGTTLVSNVTIGPLFMDAHPTDNGNGEIDVVVFSWDPNLKECSSITMNEFGDIWPTDLELDYTIHFQNTGTDTAFTVVVVDTLPAELDITTFRMGASSHPCTYTINGYNGVNEVKFTFMNILLVDSTTNEPASHGFCQFTIDRFANLPIGTQIMNEANNYFDFNPAIVTNMDTVTIWDPLSLVETSRANVFVYPNPAQDNVNILLSNEFSGNNSTVTLRDISGRTIATMQTNGATQIVLNITNYSAGMYFITIQSATQETFTQQLIISEK